jgi:hypothetical protein
VDAGCGDGCVPRAALGKRGDSILKMGCLCSGDCVLCLLLDTFARFSVCIVMKMLVSGVLWWRTVGDVGVNANGG